MSIEEIIEKIHEEVLKIQNGLPFGGRRMEIQEYLIPEEWFNILLDDETFKLSFEEDYPNIGGIPVRKSNHFEIKFIQKEKRKKVWKKEDSI